MRPGSPGNPFGSESPTFSQIIGSRGRPDTMIKIDEGDAMFFANSDVSEKTSRPSPPGGGAGVLSRQPDAPARQASVNPGDRRLALAGASVARMVRMRRGHDSGGRTGFNDSLGSQGISEESGDAKFDVFTIPHPWPTRRRPAKRTQDGPLPSKANRASSGINTLPKRTQPPSRSPGPPGEYHLGRGAAPLPSGPDDAERRRCRPHGGPWERVLL